MATWPGAASLRLQGRAWVARGTLQQGLARAPPCGAVHTVGPPLSGHRPVTLGRHPWRSAASALVMRQLTHTVGLDSLPSSNLCTYCAPGPDLGTGVQPASGPVPVPAHLSWEWGADTLPDPPIPAAP